MSFDIKPDNRMPKIGYESAQQGFRKNNAREVPVAEVADSA